MPRARTKPEPSLPRIFTVRKRKVVLDSDLAALYGVPTKRLNEAVRRNAGKFPEEFCFTLTSQEVANLRSQFATSSSAGAEPLISQIAISSSGVAESPRSQTTILENGHGGRRALPRVFSEHGALMAATILRSKRAEEMSIYLIRAFVAMRDAFLTNSAILRRLAEIDKRLLEHDTVLREVVTHLQALLDAPPPEEVPPRPKIGFHQGNR
jgi:hypothetical protein